MKDTIKFFIYVLVGAFCLMLDAFYNGFPIVYSDTSTYIASGFELETPFDRPITYGLFLRFFSLNGLSLWFVIFFQGLILSYLIFLLVRLVTDGKLFLKVGLLTIIFLSLFTGVSWTVSQIMPDIFTSIALLCMTLILLDKYNRRTLIMLYVIFFFSVAMHMSHILLFTTLFISIFFLRKFILPKLNYPKRNLQIMTLLFLTMASVITMGSAISKSKHVFFMGAMVEHGIVKNYLDDYCDTKQYKLCIYKDSLPDRAYKFVWDEKSPFYKTGGWKQTKHEFNEIIAGTLTHPKFITMHINESFKATLQQLTLFAIGDGNGSFLQGTLLYDRVSKYFSHDLPAYTGSKQSQARLNYLGLFNSLFLIVILLSLLFLLFLMIKFTGILNRHLKIIVIIFFGGLIFNAWICGTFANSIDRLGAKMIWLIPFTTTIILWGILHHRRAKESKI
ncbi:MAG: hypothetical protein WBP41_21985 [Saprospiraceae bacterium]